MFWGLIMEPKRRYSQEVTRPFHVSMASLDISSCTDDPVQLMVMFQKRNYLLCTLQKGVAVQVPLDLNFESGDEVSFSINGASHIHLTGYHIEDDFEDIAGDEEEDEETVEDKNGEEVEEEEEEEDEDDDLSESNIVYGKRKQATSSVNVSPAAKRSKTLELLGDLIGSDDDDSDDEDVIFSNLGDDDGDEGELTIDSLDDEALDEEEDDGEEEEDVAEEEDEQEDEEESDEEELKKQVVQQQQQQQTKKQKNKQKQEQQAINQKQQKAQKQKNEQQIKKGQQQQQQINESPVSEKKKKKNKQQASPAKEAKEKKIEQIKTPKSDKKQQNQQTSAKKKFVDRGVTIEDISIGGGPPAKAGKFAHLYYEGRLKQNNKMFDSTVKGPPFKFRLGSDEVIKGWDVGVLGMKVGGKRRITVPPQMAYGSKGIPPQIPPNSTLIFDLELKQVA